MGKYEPLTRYLADSTPDSVELSFSDLERILGQPLPPSARSRREWWYPRGHAHATAWTRLGYRAETSTFAQGTIRFAKVGSAPDTPRTRSAIAGTASPASPAPLAAGKTRPGWPIAQHLRALDTQFEHYVEICSQRKIFSGPSVYFYERALEHRRGAPSLDALARERDFHELVYATLTSWGMHRMGETTAAKLTEFALFSDTLHSLIREVRDMSELSITNLVEADYGTVTERLAALAARPGLTASSAPLVTNTKTLHFILPDLVPPMDRTYTGRFFFGPYRGMALPGPTATNFLQMFSGLHALAKSHAKLLRSMTGSTYLCLGHAKVLDNAIIGYVLSHPRLFPRAGKGRSATPD